VIVAIALGTLLNPLNSSMIAVAVVALQQAFHVGVATSSWLLSGFYLTACVGQPLMGRLADRYGPRKVYCLGLAIVLGAGLAALVAPAFWWVLACRMAQAAGTSAAYPAGLAVIRRLAASPKPPAAALAAISITNASSAAFGPVLGGFLVSAAGWRGIFAVNIPLTVVGLTLARRWLPPDAALPSGAGPSAAGPSGAGPSGAGPSGARPPGARPPAEPYRPRHAAVAEFGPWAPAHRAPATPVQVQLDALDLPGLALFALTVLGVLGFLLSIATDPVWVLVVLVPVAAAALVWRERRTPVPFLDVTALAANRRLLTVLGQQVGVQFVFYAVFFGLPLWLQQARHLPPHTAGVLMLPIAVLGVALTPFAARLVTRYGPRLPLVIGCAGLLVGSAMLLLLSGHASVVTLVSLSALIGLPNGLNNLGLQAALYASAPADQTGLAAGLFQTCRYLGAILATALLGLVFAHEVSGVGLHRIGYLTTAVAAVLFVAALRRSDRQAGAVER
jgi:MFS family permease